MNNEALNDIGVFLSRYPDNSNSAELQETEVKLGQKK
jgi:hypothetical protein